MNFKRKLSYALISAQSLILVLDTRMPPEYSIKNQQTSQTKIYVPKYLRPKRVAKKIFRNLPREIKNELSSWIESVKHPENDLSILLEAFKHPEKANWKYK